MPCAILAGGLDEVTREIVLTCWSVDERATSMREIEEIVVDRWSVLECETWM